METCAPDLLCAAPIEDTSVPLISSELSGGSHCPPASVRPPPPQAKTTPLLSWMHAIHDCTEGCKTCRHYTHFKGQKKEILSIPWQPEGHETKRIIIMYRYKVAWQRRRRRWHAAVVSVSGGEMHVHKPKNDSKVMFRAFIQAWLLACPYIPTWYSTWFAAGGISAISRMSSMWRWPFITYA